MKTVGRLLVLVPFLVLLGCAGKDTSFSLMAASQTFEQTEGSSANNKLDILFLIGDEPSMSSKQAQLVTSMATFMSQFIDRGFDFKIAVGTTSGYMADSNLSGYNPANAIEADFNDFNGTTHSGFFVIDNATPDLQAAFAINAKPNKNTAGQDSRPFSSFRAALNNTSLINNGFHRADAFLAVIIVTNSEDYSDNGRCVGCGWGGRASSPTLDDPSVYVNFLDTFTGSTATVKKYSVSAMTQSVAACQGGVLMNRVIALANATDGAVGDICQADFGPQMVLIANQIATLSTKFYLDREPVESTIVVQVNGVTVPNDATNGWTYDSASVSIEFHGSAIPSQGDQIGVDFDPTTIL
jgi:hypothetical protein